MSIPASQSLPGPFRPDRRALLPVGLAANGTSAVGNKGDGIYVLNSPNNTIGGSGDARNFVCANSGNGIVINGNANYLLSNSIGTNCVGSSVPNAKKALLQFI